MTDADLDLAPLWRGSVRRWECDENDHLNVRFHFAAASEAIEALFRARYRRPAPAIRRQHARFVAEALVATPLLARGAFVAADADGITVYVELVHGLHGSVHSTFTCELDVAPAELALDAAALPGLGALPDHGARRGLATPIRTTALPDLERAEALPMVEIGRGVFGPDEAPGGAVPPAALVGRIADGILSLIAHVHGGDTLERRQTGGIGGAVVEYDLVYPRPATAGTPFVARSGIAALEGRIQRFCHWVFDATSGEMIAGSNAVAVALDLETRRAAHFDADARAAIEARCAPELVL
jgi:acyl-CoA thioester hydrolase